MEILKTVGDHHSCLSGRQVIVREYPDMVIEDQFTVIRRYQTKRDSEGVYYDWYEITDHSRDTDRIKRVEPIVEQNTADIAYIAIASDIDLGGK